MQSIEIHPGTVHLAGYLSIEEQRTLSDHCFELGAKPIGRYRPTLKNGSPMNLEMLCLGRHWNAASYQYEAIRSDHDRKAVPPLPESLKALAATIAERAEPRSRPTSASSTTTAPRGGSASTRTTARTAGCSMPASRSSPSRSVTRPTSRSAGCTGGTRPRTCCSDRATPSSSAARAGCASTESARCTNAPRRTGADSTSGASTSRSARARSKGAAGTSHAPDLRTPRPLDSEREPAPPSGAGGQGQQRPERRTHTASAARRSGRA